MMISGIRCRMLPARERDSRYRLSFFPRNTNNLCIFLFALLMDNTDGPAYMMIPTHFVCVFFLSSLSHSRVCAHSRGMTLDRPKATSGRPATLMRER